MNTYRSCNRRLSDYKDGSEKWHSFILLLVLPTILRADITPSCPSVQENNKCPCYKFEDGLFLECPNASPSVLRRALERVDGPIQSFSVYELDKDVELLSPSFIPDGACIRHLHIAQTCLRDIDDDTFVALRACLETLSIVSSKMEYIPQKAFAGLNKMISLNLEYNAIAELPGYSFFGLPLIKLNVKGNRLREISEFAFSSLEDSLSEVDLSENELAQFPMVAIQKMRLLRSLRLAWNDISTLPSQQTSELMSLVYLDLSSNNFVTIPEDCFASCPSVKILSLHFNFIEDLSKLAFQSLINLESLDLSHNLIKNINREIFVNNKNLRHIDFSHNHIHHIGGVFCSLPLLMEVYLTKNNILEVPIDAFTNSTSISVLYLEDNSLNNLQKDSLDNLDNLTQLHLGFNVLTKVPHKIFRSKSKLVSLSLDNNNLIYLDEDSFKDLIMLKEIRLQCNFLKIISKNLFSNCKHLQEIHLQKNNITLVQVGAFEGLANLQYINLQENLIWQASAVIPRPRSSLVSLHFDGNLISNIEQLMLHDQPLLQILWLGNNVISHIYKHAFGNLSAVERIYLNANKIAHIEDLSFSLMKSVKYLDLRNNYLQTISNLMLIGLSELEELYLTNNKISNIIPKSFHMLKKLRILNLSDNYLKVINNDLFKEGLPLRTLSLQNCSIWNIEDEAFKGLNNLNSLSLEHNLLRSEDVARIRVPGLKTLKLSFNNLSQLQSDAFRYLPLIQALYLDSCRVNYIPPDTFANNAKIHKISLRNNYIQDIEAPLFTNNLLLNDINFSENMLQDVPYNILANLNNLEIINLSKNLISSVQLDTFLNLKKLKQLFLNSNKIEHISGVSNSSSEQVVTLDISSNCLKTFPDNLFQVFPNLQRLNLSYNRVSEIKEYFSEKKYNYEITTLDLSNNPLGSSLLKYSGKEQNMLKILELYVNENEISLLTADMLKFVKEVHHLNINRNKIEELLESPFIDMAQMQTLDLSENNIAYLLTSNFIGLQELTSLNLSHNSIVKLEMFPTDLRKLKSLDLSYNEIDNLNANAIENLQELAEINLCNNHIKAIDDHYFEHQKKMKSLNLMNNDLEALSSKILLSIERQIRELFFEGNPLTCGCEARDLWMWLRDHPRLSTTAVNFRCHKPYWLYEQPLHQVNMAELCELPVISDVEIYRRGRHSISVSWQVRNESAIRAYQIVYYSGETTSDIKTELLDINTHSIDISGLRSSTEYVLCVVAVHDDGTAALNSSITIPIILNNETSSNSNASETTPESLLVESPFSECTTFSTEHRGKIVKSVSNAYSLSKILTRRLGLIVGCSMGVVVFILLVSVLGYMKSKKRKLIPDPDQIGSELNFRNSIHSSDDILQLPKNYSSENILLGMNKKKMSTSK